MDNTELSSETDGIAQDAFAERCASPRPDIIIDVRRASDFVREPGMIPGAMRGDPDALDEWARALPADRDIVVYCVRGGSVSRSVAPQLARRGLRARYLIGGLEGWKARGGKTKLGS